MRRHLGKLVFALGIGFTAAAMFNVYSDNAEVERAAFARACGEPPGEVGRSKELLECAPQLTRFERTPFSQTFHVQITKGPQSTSKVEKPTKETVRVSCTRSAVLVGPYTCAR